MKTIYLLVDSDCDGYCSASILYQYLKKINNSFKLIPIFHKQKQHGLSDKNVMELLKKSEPSILIISDASADENNLKELNKLGYKILILDHHTQDLTDSKYAIIVDNQYSNEVENKGLSGCGVTWKFLKALDLKLNLNYAKDYLSYVALSIVSDSCPMNYEENRSFVLWGLKHLHKNLIPFFKVIKKDINNTSVAWELVPLINSCVRMGNEEDKENLFYAMCGEYNAEDCIKQLKLLHVKQQKTSQQMSNEISSNMTELENGLIAHIDEQTTMTGLVAGKISYKYMKPILLTHDDGTACSGSFRSPVPILEYLQKSELFNYVVGHDCAGGIAYNNSKLPLIEKFFTFLNIDSTYNVLRSYKIDEIPDYLFSFYDKIEVFIGQGINCPSIHIKPFILLKKQVKYIGKNKNVLKFSKDGIDFIKFFVSDDFIDKLSHDIMEVEIIGFPKINEFAGRKTKQIEIDRMEIKDFIPY
jgi:single-stranded-DNA-specific exonuclease